MENHINMEFTSNKTYSSYDVTGENQHGGGDIRAQAMSYIMYKIGKLR